MDDGDIRTRDLVHSNVAGAVQLMPWIGEQEDITPRKSWFYRTTCGQKFWIFVGT